MNLKIAIYKRTRVSNNPIVLETEALLLEMGNYENISNPFLQTSEYIFDLATNAVLMEKIIMTLKKSIKKMHAT